MRTLIFALMVLALMHAFKPYYSDSSAAVSREQVENLSLQTRYIAPEDVRSYLVSSQRPTMLMVYASWCAYCKKVMPSMYELWSERKIEGGQMLFISVDTQPTLLASYLLGNGFDKMTGRPLMLQQVNSTLSHELRTLGAGFTGGIPYIGFFDAGGKLNKEFMGYADKSEIEDDLGVLRK